MSGSPASGHQARAGRMPRSRRILARREDVFLLAGLAVVAFLVRVLPVLARGGLDALRSYDEGVYFASAISLVEGFLPYRDFLLLHPPGIVVALVPFAALGSLVGDPVAFTVARLAAIVVGSLSAVMVALIAGSYGRLAGLIGGALYAVWGVSVSVERKADLLVFENALLLLGLLVLSRPGRIGPRRAAVIGGALGFATAVHLWQAVAVVIVLGWILVRARGVGRERLRPLVAYVAGVVVAFGLVCLPFLLAAPDAMIRLAFLDQVGRPHGGIGAITRLGALEGFGVGGHPVPWLIVLGIAVGGAAVVAVTAWRCPWTRPWAALAVAQAAVVLVTPSFHADYSGMVAPAATLVLGTALAVGADRLARPGVGPVARRVVVAILLVVIAVPSLARGRGTPLPLAAIEAEVAGASCVAADSPALLVMTSVLRRNHEAGCAIIVDPVGVFYDTNRDGRQGARIQHRKDAPGFQQAMLDYFSEADAALFVRPSLGLTDATQAEIERHLPVERRHGAVTVRLPAEPGG